MKSEYVQISRILKNYDLCEYCTGRFVSKLVGKPSSKLLGKKYLKKFGKSSNTKCYVLKNIFKNFDYQTLSIIIKFENVNITNYLVAFLYRKHNGLSNG